MSDNVKEHINIALGLHQSGNWKEAEKLYLEILRESPDNANVLNLLGILKLQDNQPQEALQLIKKAAKLSPCAYYLENLGRAYFENKNFEESINSYRKAFEFEPDNFDILFNLALTYKNNGQIDEAIENYKKAIEIIPDNSKAYFNLAGIYDSLNDTFNALENYKKAYEYNPEDEDINYFLAEAYLKTKHFKEGWKHYQSRASRDCTILSQTLLYKEAMSNPMWRGEDIKDKTLFIYYESALGDTIMYARFFPEVVSRCKKVLFAPQNAFMEFFKENNFGMQIIDNRTLPHEVVCDVHIPLMELPYVLGINEEKDIPYAQGYLKANPEKVESYKQNYFNNDKFKIGIKWQGNTAYSLDRIIPLKAFYKIFDLPNTKFYSVQKGEGSEELQELPSEFELISLGDTFNDFSDTAAAIANLDLLICNDTSVAHLAGALGKPCWVLLPFVQNWRWTTDLSYSPWYKSIKPFKQIEPGNWDEVFERVYKELVNRCEQ